jgi:hypothetical protein
LWNKSSKPGKSWGQNSNMETSDNKPRRHTTHKCHKHYYYIAIRNFIHTGDLIQSRECSIYPSNMRATNITYYRKSWNLTLTKII